jgi:hypothetical protein
LVLSEIAECAVCSHVHSSVVIDFFLVVVQGQLLTVKYVILQSLISTSAVMQGFRLVVDLSLVEVMLFNVVSSVMFNQSFSQRSKVSFPTGGA